MCQVSKQLVPLVAACNGRCIRSLLAVAAYHSGKSQTS